jgi:hypothetical protein
MAGDDGALARVAAAQRALPRVEPEAALGLVARVAGEAALLEDRPDVALEIDRGRGPVAGASREAGQQRRAAEQGEDGGGSVGSFR